MSRRGGRHTPASEAPESGQHPASGTNARDGSAEPAARLLLVDGHAYAYRAYYAIRQLRSPSGRPTNAIYGFLKMLDKMQTRLAPSHLAVVWDGGLAAERTAEHPDYKTNRPPMPPELDEQIPGIVDWLRASGLATCEQQGVEADDWIASLALAAAPAMPVVIASSDKDFMQLVSERIGLLNPNDKSEKIWAADDVRAKAGVDPAQVVDWLSLIGDAVDNIPGVPGVGPRTATDLLAQFGSADTLYARVGELKSERLRAALAASEPAVRRNQRLIRLKADLAAPPLERLRPGPSDVEHLRGLYARWGFKSLLAALPADQLAPAPAQAALL